MLMGEYFDETPAENLTAFPRKNRPQFAGYANDGTGNDSKTIILSHSSKRENEQFTEHDASGSGSELSFMKMFRFCSEIGWERCCYS